MPMRLTASALFLAACLTAAAPVGAQSLSMGQGDGPIEVLADNGIEWQQDLQRFVARGNAVAIRGAVKLHADELIAYYDGGKTGDQGDGASEISRMEAHGNVRITSPDEEATGDDAVYHVAEERMILTGEGVRLKTPNEVLTAGKRVTYDVTGKRATAEGGAVLQQTGGRTLRASTLVAHFYETGGRTEISTVDANGNVVITTENETARGSQGKYDAKTGIATLTGSVTLTRGENILTGAQAVTNMRTGVSTLTGGADSGRARAVLVPEKKTPQDGAQDAGKPQ